MYGFSKQQFRTRMKAKLYENRKCVFRLQHLSSCKVEYTIAPRPQSRMMFAYGFSQKNIRRMVGHTIALQKAAFPATLKETDLLRKLSGQLYGG